MVVGLFYMVVGLYFPGHFGYKRPLGYASHTEVDLEGSEHYARTSPYTRFYCFRAMTFLFGFGFLFFLLLLLLQGYDISIHFGFEFSALAYPFWFWV